MKTISPTINEGRFILKKMLTLAGDEVAGSHQWVSEFDRWKELVFSLLSQTTKLSQTMVRFLTDHLAQLDMLDIPVLSGIRYDKPAPNLADHPIANRIMETMKEAGLTADEASRGLTAICEAADFLMKQYKGKIQVCLRQYGEKMVEDMQKEFNFSGLGKMQSRNALTFWMQNVLNMPLTLQDKSIEKFSEVHGLTQEQLFTAADEMDINVALVDDLVHYFHYVSEDQSE